jgi:hypothetical protein
MSIQDDQLGNPSTPRELITLREITSELRQAVARRDREHAASMVSEIERAWKRVNTMQITLSAQGGHGDLLVTLAESLNEAQRIRGNALSLSNGLGVS